MRYDEINNMTYSAKRFMSSNLTVCVRGLIVSKGIFQEIEIYDEINKGAVAFLWKQNDRVKENKTCESRQYLHQTTASDCENASIRQLDRPPIRGREGGCIEISTHKNICKSTNWATGGYIYTSGGLPLCHQPPMQIPVDRRNNKLNQISLRTKNYCMGRKLKERMCFDKCNTRNIHKIIVKHISPNMIMMIISM